MKTRFIVMSSQAKMPSSCWGKYRRVAVCEVEEGFFPKMISERARGMIDIVQTWGPVFVGKTSRCAFQRAWDEAENLAEKLNAEREKS